jgi:predicted RNase H-like HicB family nuclease
MKVLLLMEKTRTGYSAYAPDVPGCVATGPSVEETEGLMREALQFHLAGMREAGSPPPEATTLATWVEVSDLDGGS